MLSWAEGPDPPPQPVPPTPARPPGSSPSSALLGSNPSIPLPDQRHWQQLGWRGGPGSAGLRTQGGEPCLPSCEGGGAALNITEDEGASSPHPVSMAMEPRARRSWGLLGLWACPGTLSLSWGLGWGWGNLGPAPCPGPLAPRRCSLGPTGRGTGSSALQVPGCSVPFSLGPQSWLPGYGLGHTLTLA